MTDVRSTRCDDGPVAGSRRPALVATDLDGTLLRSDVTVSAHTVATLRAVELAGARVVIVTGRPTRSMVPVAEALGHTGVAICANGAVVYDLATDQIVGTHVLDPTVVLEVVETVRDAIPGVSFALELADLGFRREPGYPAAGMSVPGSAGRIGRAPASPEDVGHIGDLIDDTVVKLLIRHADLEADELLSAAHEVAGDLVELTHSSRVGLLEVSAAGVTKATTLAAYAADHGIDADGVIAFGDMPNDLPMLAWAGTSYAMANAHPGVLSAVGRTAPHHDEDGVAQVLAEVFDL